MKEKTDLEGTRRTAKWKLICTWGCAVRCSTEEARCLIVAASVEVAVLDILKETEYHQADRKSTLEGHRSNSKIHSGKIRERILLKGQLGNSIKIRGSLTSADIVNNYYSLASGISRQETRYHYSQRNFGV